MKPRREAIASQSALVMTHGSDTCNNTQIVSSPGALFATKRSPGCGQVCSEGMALKRVGAMHFKSAMHRALHLRCTLVGAHPCRRGVDGI
jgi:hypothetical protein